MSRTEDDDEGLEAAFDSVVQRASADGFSYLRHVVWMVEERARMRAPSTRDHKIEELIGNTLEKLFAQSSTAQHWKLGIAFAKALTNVDYTDRTVRLYHIFHTLAGIVKQPVEWFAREAAATIRHVLACLDRSDAHLIERFNEEFKGLCDVLATALTQARGSASVGVFLALSAGAEFEDGLLAGHRQRLIGLSCLGCSSTDSSVRSAAFQCLSSVVEHLSKVRGDMSKEFEKLFDHITKVLRSSGQKAEAEIVGAVLATKALLLNTASSTGGVAPAASRDRASTLSTTMMEVFKSSRSPLVKNSIIGAIPALARHDPAVSSRFVVYAAAILDPLKSTRETGDKTPLLKVLSEFITVVGFDRFDKPGVTNVQAIAVDAIQKLHVEGWEVVASVARTACAKVAEDFMKHVASRCMECIGHFPLTTPLVRALEDIAEHSPLLKDALGEKLSTAINNTLMPQSDLPTPSPSPKKSTDGTEKHCFLFSQERGGTRSELPNGSCTRVPRKPSPCRPRSISAPPTQKRQRYFGGTSCEYLEFAATQRLRNSKMCKQPHCAEIFHVFENIPAFL